MNIPQKLILFLDYDGTLSPIVRDPDNAILPPNVKLWLRNMSQEKNIKIAIVTGRAMSDIRNKVGLKNIIYAADHGMEVFYNGRYILKKGASYRKPLQSLAHGLRKSLANISGVIVENKGLSIAVHFRRVKATQHSIVKANIRKVLGEFISKYDLQLTKGKMIFEIRPKNYWNKGKAVLWMWQKLASQYFPVYVGDDTTDEDAFLALLPYGLTIRVGKATHSYAKYRASSIKAVIRLRQK